MVMTARFAWPIVLALFPLAGCAQVLGLGDYGESPPADPADATLLQEVGADGGVAERARDRSSGDIGADASDAYPPETGPAADSGDAHEAQTEAIPGDGANDEAADGADAADAETPDASADTAIDEHASDAPADTSVVCPVSCNGGCGSNGATCIISVTAPGGTAVLCPLGLPCEVHCTGTQVCTQPIDCAPGQPCRVICLGDEACSSGVINGAAASSLCVECFLAAGPRGNPGCNSVTCTGVCAIHCDGGCGGSCANCATVSACP
jgi:hypothetical protein